QQMLVSPFQQVIDQPDIERVDDHAAAEPARLQPHGEDGGGHEQQEDRRCVAQSLSHAVSCDRTTGLSRRRKSPAACRARMVQVAAVALSASSASRFARPIAIAAAVAGVVFLYLAKVGLFKGLQYTFDLFGFVQMSRGWLRGHPLLFENGWGNHAQIHNYYT